MCITLCLPENNAFAAKQSPLDEQQTMQVLFANLQVKLPTSQGCISSGTATVGKFVQTTLAYLAQEKRRGGLSRIDYVRIELDDEVNKDLMKLYSKATGFPANVRKTLANMKKGNVLYQYTIWWNYAENENVWSRGIQFLVHESDGSPVEGSFRCLSMP